MGRRAAVVTSYAKRGGLSPAQAADLLANASTPGAVLDPSLGEDFLDVLCPALLSAGVPILAACPRGSPASLCGPDREESRAALSLAEAALARAHSFGARFVVLQLGQPAALAR